MATDIELLIEKKLRDAFAPDQLEIENDSHRHAHHTGSPGTGSSHFNVSMTAAAFEGVGRVDRQRQVYGVLADELAGPVHALALKLKAPSQSSP